MLRRLEGLGFVGCDIVEVAPAYDVSEITALAGATVAWEYVCLIGRAVADGTYAVALIAGTRCGGTGELGTLSVRDTATLPSGSIA